jgi:uncharacterized membrane protein YeaQ/YmgE (transglycosylase-associated protein family)
VPTLVLVVLALVILFMLAIWITGLVVGLLIQLLFAGVLGWLADKLLPGRFPYGAVGYILAGLVGGWIGRLILPAPLGISLIPAFVGTIVVVALASLVAGQSRRLGT